MDDPVETIWNSTAFQIGASAGGHRVNKRDLVIPLHVVGTEDTPWQYCDSDLRKAFSYDFDSKLHCRTDEWGHRWLDLRLGQHPEYGLHTDPWKQEFVSANYHLVAGFPRWIAKDATDQWIAQTDTTGEGAAFEEGTVTVSNPTDVEAWMLWTVQAYPGAVYKLPDFSFGDNRFRAAAAHVDRKVTLPGLIAGEHLRVNTDEEQEQVVSSLDTQVWQRMRGVRFLYPLPPYLGTRSHPTIKEPVELPVAVKGAPPGVGVQVRIPRKWSRPWGLD